MLLEAHDITKTFRVDSDAFTALRSVSIAVDESEMVGLIGSSGSGKSTLAAVIVGLEAADSGTVEFDGEACDASRRLSKRPEPFRTAMAGMQMVFQHPASTFSDRMRIGAGIEEGIAYRGVSKPERRRLMLDALETVGLPAGYADKYAWELSGGECQRAAIARAIVSRPKLLICDEPTSALDVTVQAQIASLLVSLCEELGMACLFISHDIALVSELCSRVYVLDGGMLVESGDIATVLAQPESKMARSLIASTASLQARLLQQAAQEAPLISGPLNG